MKVGCLWRKYDWSFFWYAFWICTRKHVVFIWWSIIIKMIVFSIKNRFYHIVFSFQRSPAVLSECVQSWPLANVFKTQFFSLKWPTWGLKRFSKYCQIFLDLTVRLSFGGQLSFVWCLRFDLNTRKLYSKVLDWPFIENQLASSGRPSVINHSRCLFLPFLFVYEYFLHHLEYIVCEHFFS